MTAAKPDFVLQCPVAADGGERITMAHGGGGLMSQQLIETVFMPLFSNDLLNTRHDGAVFNFGGACAAFSTDSYVVKPLFFPGGNIGDLAINGTVNDLAMCAAEPLYLSCSFILEEGLEIATLRTIAASMQAAAKQSGVLLVTGDTKVVERGKADGMYINTAGIGRVRHRAGAERIQTGDAILVSGDLGAHGITILSTREGLAFESALQSDTAPLWEPVAKLLDAGIDIHCLRDLTRGGLTSALNELAKVRGIAMGIEEAAIPVAETVRGACELLGLDPLYVANEGRFVAFVAAAEADEALQILRHVAVSQGAVLAGKVLREGAARVFLRSASGGDRVLHMISGEQLPRIC